MDAMLRVNMLMLGIGDVVAVATVAGVPDVILCSPRCKDSNPIPTIFGGRPTILLLVRLEVLFARCDAGVPEERLPGVVIAESVAIEESISMVTRSLS